jgi:homeobox protein cut-like
VYAEFQKYPPDDKIKNIGVILRAYQKEIDNLTKRSQASESAFLTVFAEFAELPDPSVALELAKVCIA